MNFKKKKIGDLTTYECKYEMREPLAERTGMGSVYVHNTFKHAQSLDGLLGFHLHRGFAGIGYHFAISPQGVIYATRPLEMMGAHVYGRNKDSVGIVMLDITACVASQPAKESFHALLAALNEVAGATLPVFTHSHGQFDYLGDRIGDYNETVDDPALVRVEHDHTVGYIPVFHEKRDEAKTHIHNHRIHHPHLPIKKEKELHNLDTLANALKICPGPAFFQLVKHD
jgi:hypothetical protein